MALRERIQNCRFNADGLVYGPVYRQICKYKGMKNDLMSRSTTCALHMNQFIINESAKCLNGDSEILAWSEWLAG